MVIYLVIHSFIYLCTYLNVKTIKCHIRRTGGLILYTTKIESTQLSFRFLFLFLSPIVSIPPILQAQVLWWSPGPVASRHIFIYDDILTSYFSHLHLKYPLFRFKCIHRLSANLEHNNYLNLLATAPQIKAITAKKEKKKGSAHVESSVDMRQSLCRGFPLP